MRDARLVILGCLEILAPDTQRAECIPTNNACVYHLYRQHNSPSASVAATFTRYEYYTDAPTLRNSCCGVSKIRLFVRRAHSHTLLLDVLELN